MLSLSMLFTNQTLFSFCLVDHLSTNSKIPTDKHKRTASGQSLHAFTFPGCFLNTSDEDKVGNFNIQDATKHLYSLQLQQEASHLVLQKQSLGSESQQ